MRLAAHNGAFFFSLRIMGGTVVTGARRVIAIPLRRRLSVRRVVCCGDKGRLYAVVKGEGYLLKFSAHLESIERHVHRASTRTVSKCYRALEGMT